MNCWLETIINRYRRPVPDSGVKSLFYMQLMSFKLIAVPKPPKLLSMALLRQQKNLENIAHHEKGILLKFLIHST